MTSETTVRVTYPDGTHRETTVKELRVFFKGETDEWQEWFFDQLETYHKARGGFAEYLLTSD